MADSSSSDRCLAAAVVVRDEWGRFLMVKENYGLRRFGFPGGRVENCETFEEAAIREALEETGLDRPHYGLALTLGPPAR